MMAKEEVGSQDRCYLHLAYLIRFESRVLGDHCARPWTSKAKNTERIEQRSVFPGT